MTKSPGKEAEAVIGAAVASGRYAAREQVIDAGLTLREAQQQKLAWQRNKVQRSIERGGSHADVGAGEYLDRLLEENEHELAAR